MITTKDQVLSSIPTPVRLKIRDITSTHEAELEIDPTLRVGAVAQTAASRMSLPADTSWALRDDTTAAFLDDDPLGQVVSMVATWAEQTIEGGLPRGWAPPPRERLDELVPAAALSFRSGSFIEPARLVADERTLRVQVSLGSFDDAMAASRRKWAVELLTDVSRLRLVRAGLRVRPGHGESIEAAIDLTGAPAPIAEALLPVAVDALRHCFVFFVTTATIIGDSGCPSRLLDASPSHITSSTRSRKT